MSKRTRRTFTPEFRLEAAECSGRQGLSTSPLKRQPYVTIP
ncbi:transposase [Teredinibacter sp. KSP-S5-2]|nr:transposase [Teredinibacter sp. KSP-S5-2]WNO07846.1 transposase [Teredinibacter sp. KSP-S5-2]